MDFFLFLLVNAVLFIRPGELIPATYAWPIYEVVFILNLVFAAPVIANQLSERSLSRTPIAVCVLGLFAFVVLSHLAQGNLVSAYDHGFAFLKVILYFLILVGVVNTPRRLFWLLATVVVCTLSVNVLAVLNYHDYIELPTLRTAADEFNRDPNTGEMLTIQRMCGTGIFGDPNDLSMLIVFNLFLCAAGLFYKQLGLARWTLLAPFVFLFYCLTLTQSRGGMLALLVGCGMLALGWLGATRGALVASAGAPVLLAGFGGRQLDISGAMSGGTGQSRVELWSSGLEMLKASPFFGVGSGQYMEHAGQVAHNAFVHAFGDLGFFGGMLFLGIFLMAGWSLWSLRSVRHEISHAGLRHTLPFLLAVVVAYCASMMSLSQTYAIPTYLIAGLVVAYDRLVRPDVSLPPLRCSGNLFAWLGVGSVAFLASIHLYIKFAYR